MDYDAEPGREPPLEPERTSAQLHAEDVDFQAGLAGVAAIVAGTHGLPEMLSDVAGFAVQAIPGADGASVIMVEPGREKKYPPTRAVTAEFVSVLDRMQYDECGEGPCLTCMETRRPTVSGFLGSDRRWQRFGGRVALLGVHSVLAIPMSVGDLLVGAINTYARDHDAFTEHAVQLGWQFAGPAAVAIHNAHLIGQARERTQSLQRALHSRAVIDQAIGIIRSRSGDTAEDAFARLTQISQHEHIKLSVVAERLVEEAVRRARARHS
jgi:transcriptional regulator with GAF, ATPase, and Fis domain